MKHKRRNEQPRAAKKSGECPIPQGRAKSDQKGVQGERLPHRTILPPSLSRRKIVLVGYNYPRG